MRRESLKTTLSSLSKEMRTTDKLSSSYNGNLHWVAIILLLLLMKGTNAYSKLTKVVLHPVGVALTDVSFQYPETWYRRLVSAVPRRDYALQDVSLYIAKELILVTGNSDSGKTTLFKLLLGKEQPANGSVIILTEKEQETDDSFTHCPCPKPVYLELQPDRFDGRASTRDIIMDMLQSLEVRPEETCGGVIVAYLSQLLDYPETALTQKRDQLSATDNYKLEILLACLESMLCNGSKAHLAALSSHDAVHLPAPLLLLDEWLDKETTVVVRRVQDCFCKISKAGAVVCVITHKPDRWNLDSVRRIQVHGGRLITSPLIKPLYR